MIEHRLFKIWVFGVRVEEMEDGFIFGKFGEVQGTHIEVQVRAGIFLESEMLLLRTFELTYSK